MNLIKKLSALLAALTLFSASAVAETAAPTPQVTELGTGAVAVCDLGDIRLHAYDTRDPLADTCFLLETDEALVALEAPAFVANADEYAAYIASLGKPLRNVLLSYHPSGADVYGDAAVVSTKTAQAAYADGGAIRTLIDGFELAFGDAFGKDVPEINQIIGAGDITIEGIAFTITETADGYDLVLPQANIVYTHMMGAAVHNILASEAQIDAMLGQMRGYQQAGYQLILSSHHMPEGQDAVAAKIAYLEQARAILESSDSAEAFMEAMREAFPDYEGENYLEMSAGLLFS